MEAAALDNANPTILSASQLPSRQKRSSARRKGPESKYSDIVFSKPSFLQYDSSSFSVSSSEDEGSWSEERSNEDELDGYQDDDFAPAAIDEQEIYGNIPLVLTISIKSPRPKQRAPPMNHQHARSFSFLFFLAFFPTNSILLFCAQTNANFTRPHSRNLGSRTPCLSRSIICHQSRRHPYLPSPLPRGSQHRRYRERDH